MILTSPLNLIPPQYKLVAELVVCALLVWAGWHCRVIYDDHEKISQYESYISEQNERYKQFMTTQSSIQDWLTARASVLQDIRDKGDVIQAMLSTKKFTVEIPNANPNNPNCPAVVLSEPARMCLMAAATGDAAAIAACQASGGDGSLPQASSVRVPNTRAVDH